MQNRLKTTPLALLTLVIAAFPTAALANLTGTPTLTANQTLSFDTGTVATSGGDILWTGTGITLQSKATAASLTSFGISGASGFSALTQTTLSALSSFYSASAIPAGTLVPNSTVLAVHTNGGNYAAVLVTVQSGTSITLQFITYGVNSGPTITQVQNNYNGIPSTGFVNSGIAQGSIFFIVGTGLASATPPLALQNSVGAQLPTTLNGATVKVTVGSSSFTPAFYYAEPTALGLVLPSTTALGAATVTVTYNNQTSAPFSITVVQTAMGFLTYNQQGTGLGEVVSFPSGALPNYTSSVPPGSTIILYGSGLGADPKPARDTTYVPVTSVAADSINALAHIYIGGLDTGPPAYQGASGFPGLDQVNLNVPSNAPTGCNVSVVGVTASGVPTNFFTLAIGSGVCSDPAFGTNGTQLQTESGLTSSSSGVVELFQATSPATSGSGTTTNAGAFGDFVSYTYTTAYASTTGEVSIPGCIVTENVNSGTTTGTSTGLDAGTITVTGPTGTVVNMPDSFTASGTTITDVGYYSASPLPTGFLPTTGGTFTFKGTGGANVGPFTATVNFPNPVLTWTNQSAAASVTRSAGLPITWTGGSAGTYVEMFGNSSSASGAYGSFTCIAPVSAGQFTVPAYVLATLPAGTGSVGVENSTVPQSFTATGINYGTALGGVEYSVNSTFN